MGGEKDDLLQQLFSPGNRQTDRLLSENRGLKGVLR